MKVRLIVIALGWPLICGGGIALLWYWLFKVQGLGDSGPSRMGLALLGPLILSSTMTVAQVLALVVLTRVRDLSALLAWLITPVFWWFQAGLPIFLSDSSWPRLAVPFSLAVCAAPQILMAFLQSGVLASNYRASYLWWWAAIATSLVFVVASSSIFLLLSPEPRFFRGTLMFYGLLGQLLFNAATGGIVLAVMEWNEQRADRAGA